MENKNILIVNYNTQDLTNALICSINKTTPNTTIYVFDNSDKTPFNNVYENVKVIDNTKERIINFEEILQKHENKTKYGAESNYGTIKHALSVDKCFDIINDNFVLLDSDVLLKRDISELFDDKYVCVGYIHKEGRSKNERISPHICFINVKMCKEKDIRYFDEKRIVGISEYGDDYDTGSSFYFDCKEYGIKEINENNYILHYGAGSWIGLTKSRKISSESWLNKYSYLWDDNIDIFVCHHKDLKQIVKNNIYKTIDSRNIKVNLPLKDDFYSELYQYKYVYDNVPLKKYVGFCHYRRYFSFLDDIPNIDELFNTYDCIVGRPLTLKITIREHYKLFHNIEDLEIVENIIKKKYNDYYDSLESFLDNNLLIPYNMFIMKKEDFKEYCDFIFGVMNEYLNIVGTDIKGRIENNKEKYLKSFSPNDTVEYQYRIGGYIIERLTNVFMIKHFKKLKWYKVIVTEQKYNKRDS